MNSFRGGPHRVIPRAARRRRRGAPGILMLPSGVVAAESNAARGIVRAGYLCGAAFVAASAIRGCVHGEDWRADLLWTAVFGGSALVLLWAVGSLGVRVLLRSSLPGEIARGNVAAGVAAGAHYAATGLIMAQCLYGDDLATLGISIVFFVIAQATLHLFVGHAVEGEFEGWGISLRSYAVALASSLVLYPVRQLGVQTLMLRQRFVLRGGALDRLVAQERNVGVSAVEAVSYLAAAVLLTGMA